MSTQREKEELSDALRKKFGHSNEHGGGGRIVPQRPYGSPRVKLLVGEGAGKCTLEFGCDLESERRTRDYPREPPATYLHPPCGRIPK